jgi:hypothetical protein
MWIENAKYGIKMTEEADEFKSTKYYQLLQYYPLQQVKPFENFQDQGYQTGEPRDD